MKELKDIVKALEFMAHNCTGDKDCESCPYHMDGCTPAISRDLLVYLKRQKKETLIGDLKEDIDLLLYDRSATMEEKKIASDIARVISVLNDLPDQEIPIINTSYIDKFGNHISNCPNCKRQLRWDSNSKYCGFCGKAVQWNDLH